MTLLEQVKGMQQQGLSEEQIVQTLRGQGFSPFEINQALEQAKIKSAIYEPSPEEANELSQDEPFSTEPDMIGGEMKPSVMETAPSTETAETETTPEYIYPTPQAYPTEYETYEPYSQPTAEIMTDIAEQISEEKTDKMKKELSILKEFSATTETKLKNIDNRVKKIEEIIEKLQATIIGKIGGYGESLSDIKKEMQLMQESFSKALPPLSEFKKSQTHKTKAKKEKKKSKGKRKAGIEHYLRR